MSVREASQQQRGNRSKTRVEQERAEAETTLRRLQARGERLLQWFPELRKTWQRDAEPSIEALLGQIQSLGGQVSRRAQETGRDLESRLERVLGELERQAVRGLGPLLSRANLASGSEVSDLDGRLAHLEERLAPLAEQGERLATTVHDVRTALDEARAEVGERFRETAMRVAAGEEVQQELGRVHAHLDALSKEQVGRSLEIAKLQDRLVRLEMRMGDVLKEQAEHAAAHQDTARRIGELDHTVAESTRGMQYVRGQVEGATAEGRATDARLTALMTARNGDHAELARLVDLLGGIQQTLRQVDLRLGDLGERHAGVRDELANLSARVSNLELAPTRPISAPLLTGRTEGH
jgi:chromosome segregation ATPase